MKKDDWQGFNYVDSTVKEISDFFVARVENLEPEEVKKKSSTAAKKTKDKKCLKNRKQEDLYSSVVESRKYLLWNVNKT